MLQQTLLIGIGLLSGGMAAAYFHDLKQFHMICC